MMAEFEGGEENKKNVCTTDSGTDFQTESKNQEKIVASSLVTKNKADTGC